MRIRAAIGLVLFVPYISLVGVVLVVILVADAIARTPLSKRYDHVNGLITTGAHYCWIWAKPLLNIREDVELPPEWFTRKDSMLVLFTHKKSMDALIIPDLFWRGGRQVRLIVKDALLGAPIVGQLLRAAGAVGLRRNDKAHDESRIKELIERSRQDNADILLAPEGTRVDSNQVGRPKLGGFTWIREGLPEQSIVMIKLTWHGATAGKTIFGVTSVCNSTVRVKGMFFERIEGEPGQWLINLYEQLAKETDE